MNFLVHVLLVFAQDEGGLRLPVASRVANGASRAPSISADGRWIAFESDATNLGEGDGDEVCDVFLHSLVSQRTMRVSDADPRPARRPSMSGDGRLVAYWQAQTATTEEGERVRWQLMCFDIEAKSSRKVDFGAEFEPYSDPPNTPSMSHDGKKIVVAARERGQPCRACMFDVASGKHELLSVGSNGELPARDVGWPAISSNGRYVAFCTDALNLAVSSALEECPLDFTDGRCHVFVRDLVRRTTEYASDPAVKQLGYTDYHEPQVSSDGRYVAFNHFDSRQSYAEHVGFVVDRQTAEAGRLLDPNRVEWFQGTVSITSMTPDGRWVAAVSKRRLLDPPPAGIPESKWWLPADQVFVFDRLAKSWSLVSSSPTGEPASARCAAACLSADGRYVAFEVDATNLVEGDSNGVTDVFVRDRYEGRTYLISKPVE